jgi:hypothetical protein
MLFRKIACNKLKTYPKTVHILTRSVSAHLFGVFVLVLVLSFSGTRTQL